MKVFILAPSGENYFREKQRIRDTYSKKANEKIICPKALVEGNKEYMLEDMFYDDIQEMIKADKIIISKYWTTDARCKILCQIYQEYKPLGYFKADMEVL